MSTIFRTKIIEGIAIPAIIKNENYFFVDIDVYADGLVDCWQLLDLDFFAERLNRHWVTTTVPDGEHISIHELGSWTVAEGKWEFTQHTFYEKVISTIRQLNPDMENLHNCHGKLIKGNVLILDNGNGIPYRESHPSKITSSKIKAQATNIFYRNDHGNYYLTALHAFADGKVELRRLPETVLLNKSQLLPLVHEGKLLTDIPLGKRVHINEFGSFVPVEKYQGLDIFHKLLEVDDLIEAINDRPTSLQTGKTIYRQFIHNPTAELRDALRMAYEKIPQHRRRYIGTMEDKDVIARRIIYGEDSLDYWKDFTTRYRDVL